MSCLMDAIEAAAKKKKTEMEAIQAKREALLPQFETEAEALAYARRVAALRPGDTVKLFNFDDTGFIDAVFTGAFDKDGDPKSLVYNPKTKRLMTANTAWHGITLP